MPQDQKSPADSPRVYRAASAPWLTGFLVLLGMVVAAAGWSQNAWLSVASVCFGVGLAGLGYALYWRPRLEIHGHGVRIINPLRTVDIPWAHIIEVRTRFTVTVVTEAGSHSCFALPAAGPGSALRSGPQGVSRAHPLARTEGAVRTGDLAGTRSGAAANDIRTLWQRKIDTGELDVFTRDDAALEPVRVAYVPAPLAVTLAVAAVGVTLFVTA
ncbi:PH domain-containing protein [Kocuria sp. cx-455]|uniref:PH domain-containing protein n=1 Tax=unclassified Candidatus Sulfotelmatobacter TaxID=2635724 RepID=UPI0016845718|nr:MULTISPECIES: PH domain-containing protein [unclassified Candidatus Sulfotelmatobacter]MBD2762558.1 PH domain-containing protein [Kocuria sp. cx-116]MBD2764537.1 PH domain-containing protein [Kocuria sp. cx-455]